LKTRKAKNNKYYYHNYHYAFLLPAVVVVVCLITLFGYSKYQQVIILEQQNSHLLQQVQTLNQSIESLKFENQEKQKNGIAYQQQHWQARHNDNDNNTNSLLPVLQSPADRKIIYHIPYNTIPQRQGHIRYLSSLGSPSMSFRPPASSSSSFLSDIDKEKTQQIKELFFFRGFTIYDYIHQKYHNLSFNVSYQAYTKYREHPFFHTANKLGEQKPISYIKQALSTWKNEPSLKNLAHALRDISADDDELFANLALQVTHAFKYNDTRYTKFPIETIVEGSGDCDNDSMFAAALMKAGGLNTEVILASVTRLGDQNPFGHAIIGVSIHQIPDDVDWKRGPTALTQDLDGNKYYAAEATYPEGVLPYDYTYTGSVVGDNPWSSIKIVNIIKTPD
jgi:hypothetical protein